MHSLIESKMHKQGVEHGRGVTQDQVYNVVSSKCSSQVLAAS